MFFYLKINIQYPTTDYSDLHGRREGVERIPEPKSDYPERTAVVEHIPFFGNSQELKILRI